MTYRLQSMIKWSQGRDLGAGAETQINGGKLFTALFSNFPYNDQSSLPRDVTTHSWLLHGFVVKKMPHRHAKKADVMKANSQSWFFLPRYVKLTIKLTMAPTMSTYLWSVPMTGIEIFRNTSMKFNFVFYHSQILKRFLNSQAYIVLILKLKSCNPIYIYIYKNLLFTACFPFIENFHYTFKYLL